MRNRKKFLAGMLAATMVLNMALSVDVSAEEGSEAQTAKNTVVEMNETAVAENNVYYVSSDGNDENSGMSAEEAFKTLDQINKLELQPGDQVLLERGSVFEDQYIHVKGSGTEEKPIIISSYGDESKPLPLINTNGKGVWYQDYNLASLDSSSHVLRGEVSSCILLYDVEYIEISNIAMTNEGNFAEGEEYNSADRMDRTGVAGITQNIGTADHIVLRNLDIRNIQGNVYNKHMCNGGIYMVCAQPKDSSTGIAKYDDVLIEGCTLDNVNRWGIAVGYTCYWDKFKTAELPDDTVRTYGSTNVVVRNNYLSDLGGDGITMMYCFRPLVERNVVKEFSRDMNNGIYKYPVSDKNGHKNRGGMLAAGIWPWKCKTPLFQYNECYDSYLSQDSQAWDADSGDNCIYQYNYSSNNAGGCVMFCLGQAVNTVFRYNISQNDLGGVLNLSGNPNGEIYNNVFYMKENVPVNRMSGGKSNIYNNIFYYDGKEAAPASVCNWGRIQANWSNNVYYNYSSIPKDENAITEDPQFVNGGKAPAGAQENGNVYDRSVFDGYKLQNSSPAIDAGKPVSDAGGQDFFGNKLDMMPDIGAFETGRYVPDSNSEIVSTPYMITGSGAKQYLNVPSKEKNPTTTTDVLENIEIAPKAQATILKEDKEVGRVVIEDGMILRVRAESNVTKDYIIKVKNDYDYGEEHSSEQGNVWFYQYKNKDGNYVNMDVQDEWGGWMESYQGGMSNTWAMVGFDKNIGDGLVSGPLYNKNGANVESAAMAWRAPKSGSVKLSFGGGSVAGGAKLRGTTSGGPSFLKITKNGEDLITPINMTETIMDLSVYSKAMSDEEMIAYTSIDVSVPEPEEPQEDGVFDESGSRYFRIPALITLADGGLMAAADARFGSAADSPNNLDTTVAFRPAGQSQWEDATIPFHFVDISDKPGVVNKNSASFIDPVIVQAKDGTIFLMADAFPYGTGSGQSKEGSGMIEADGNKYLALTEKGKDVTNMNNFTMGIKEDGTVWDFTNNKATEYTVDKEFNLYKNGQALTVEQRDPNLKYNGKNVPMNIFYEDSELQVYRTSYLWMASSKDGGKTWSSPQILNELKDKDEKFLGFGPGRGHVIQKGKFAGRILIPVYSTVAGRGERASVLYSDDNGITWKKGPVTTLTTSESLNPGKTSEAQFVELPDGSVRMYARGTTGYVGYADSEDGITYGAFKEDPQLAYCGNSMVSVINYSKTIEGKPVLILSSPEHREIRKNGVMRIGLINENTDGSEKYTVDWKYRYEINRDEFIYSCLTELPDGNIGLLYETHVDNGAPMNYAEYRLQDVLQEEDSAIEKIVISPKNPKPGDEITATVTLKKPATNAEKLSDATLDILYPGLERGKDILTFQSISEGNKVLTYKGTLAESESSYDFIVRMPEWCSHPTVGKKSPVVETEDGLVNPANKDTVYGNASVDVQQVDKLKLEALIAYAESQKEKAEYADVVDVVKTLFEKTLTEAKAVMADEKAEQAAVDAAYEALLANVHLLGFTGNTDDLALALELAKTTNTEGKTPESVQVLKDAIAKAEEIIADGNVLQEEIDAAREALLAAIDGLEDVVLADKTKLKGLLEDSQKYVEKIDEYTKATADAFMAAREAAQSVYDNQEATQEQVNAAYDTLLQAIFGLRLIPDKSKLEELLKEAEGIDLAKYTEETVVVFRTVLAKAEAVFGNGNASETEVKEAEKMLRAAMDGLEEKKANPEKPNSAQGESGQQGNTKPNGGADKATKTGDEALSIVWMMLMVAGAVVVFKRKKRSI